MLYFIFEVLRLPFVVADILKPPAQLRAAEINLYIYSLGKTDRTPELGPAPAF